MSSERVLQDMVIETRIGHVLLQPSGSSPTAASDGEIPPRSNCREASSGGCASQMPIRRRSVLAGALIANQIGIGDLVLSP